MHSKLLGYLQSAHTNKKDHGTVAYWLVWYARLNPIGCFNILEGVDVLVGRDPENWWGVSSHELIQIPDFLLASFCLMTSQSLTYMSESTQWSTMRPQNPSCMPRTSLEMAATGSRRKVPDIRSTRSARAMLFYWVTVTRLHCVTGPLSFFELFLSCSRTPKLSICY